MRRALRQNANRSTVGTGAMIPAPVAGLNARDGLLGMGVADAVLMDNWFPDATGCEVRKGFASHATGLGAAVETLMEWSGPTTAGRKFFGAAGANIYEISAAGAVGAAAVGSLTSARWQHTMFANAAGTWLVACNGVDAVRNFSGSSWSTPTITPASGLSLTSSTLNCPASFKRRLWFLETGTLRAWYLGTDAVSGEANLLDLGPVFRLGGRLVAVLPISFESSGTGPDDYLVFLTDRGEVAMYGGTDPATPGMFALKGVFRMPPPVGDRPAVRWGADALVLTTEGLIGLSQITRADLASQGKLSVTDKVQRIFAVAAEEFGSVTGWQVLPYPLGRRIICNMPTAPATQLVMNTTTGAWCRFTGMAATCWGLFKEQLYFGGSGGEVFLADVARSDNGNLIEADLATAWQAVGGGGRVKRFTAMRPLMTSDGQPKPICALNGDFQGGEPADILAGVGSAGAVWNGFNWNEGLWGGPPLPSTGWTTQGAIGVVVSARVRVRVKDMRVRLDGIELRMEVARGSAF